MNREEKFIKLANKIAHLSEHNMRIGAVVAKGSRVLSFGINKYKSHPQQINPYTLNTGLIHAELNAIINCRTDITGGTIYISRLLKNGLPALSKPCKSCMKMISLYGIKKIVYTTEIGIEIENI